MIDERIARLQAEKVEFTNLKAEATKLGIKKFEETVDNPLTRG